MRVTNMSRIEREVEYRLRKIREEAPIFLGFYKGLPDQKDRLYGYFSIYPDPKREDFFVICPLCGWRSKLVRPSYAQAPRLAYFNTVAKILGRHVYKAHNWRGKYKRSRIRIYNYWGEPVYIETAYTCLRCGAVLPNFLVSVLHELVCHVSDGV